MGDALGQLRVATSLTVDLPEDTSLASIVITVNVWLFRGQALLLWLYADLSLVVELYLAFITSYIEVNPLSVFS